MGVISTSTQHDKASQKVLEKVAKMCEDTCATIAMDMDEGDGQNAVVGVDTMEADRQAFFSLAPGLADMVELSSPGNLSSSRLSDASTVGSSGRLSGGFRRGRRTKSVSNSDNGEDDDEEESADEMEEGVGRKSKKAARPLSASNATNQAVPVARSTSQRSTKSAASAKINAQMVNENREKENITSVR